MSQSDQVLKGGPETARVALLPLFYGRHDIVSGCLDALLRVREPIPFEIFAIENPSVHSSVNRPYLRAALGRGDLSALFLSDVNAVFNSLFCALLDDVFELRDRFDYIVLSDGDIAPEGAFLAEEISLLEAYPKMSSVALQIDLSRWDTRDPSFAAGVLYGAEVQKAARSGRPYVVYGSGMWMRMFRTNELFKMLRDFDRNGFRLRDGQIDRYFQAHDMFPACTLNAKGVELNRGPQFIVDDTRHTDAEGALSAGAGFRNLWNHDILPSGVIERGSDRRPVAWSASGLTAPSSPEEPTELTECPVITEDILARHDHAQVVAKLEWDRPYDGSVIILDRQLRRAFLGPEESFVATPLTVLERSNVDQPFLNRVSWDLRGASALHTSKMLRRVMAAIAGLLLPRGKVTLQTLDWASWARSFAAASRRTEAAARGWGGKVRKKASASWDCSRVAAGRPSLFDPGEILLASEAAGFRVVRIERLRDGQPSLVFTLERKA